MAEDSRSCPFCGEYIKLMAKKCRFCGEWLNEEAAVPTNYENRQEYKEAVPLEVATVEDLSNNVPVQNPNYAMQQQPGATAGYAPQAAVNPTQTTQTVGGQPVIVNVVNQQTVTQSETVIIKEEKKENPDWIFGEMWFIGAVVGLYMKSWWWFFGVSIIGSILLLIPFIGALVCVALGLGWGFLAGAFCAGLFESGAAGIVIGLLVAVGTIYGHLEARKQNMEEE